MAGIQKSRYAEILFSCIEENDFKDEMTLEFHAFARIISGEMKVIQADKTYLFGPGDTLLFPCNQLSTLIKKPKDGQPYKAIVISLTPERLKAFYGKNPVQTTTSQIPASGPLKKMYCWKVFLFLWFLISIWKLNCRKILSL